MNIKKFKTVLLQNGSMDAGYIEIPFDVEKEYGMKRIKVKALHAFQNLSYTQQKNHVMSIENAKQENTRTKRIAAIAAEMENK